MHASLPFGTHRVPTAIARAITRAVLLGVLPIPLLKGVVAVPGTERLRIYMTSVGVLEVGWMGVISVCRWRFKSHSLPAAS